MPKLRDVIASSAKQHKLLRDKYIDLQGQEVVFKIPCQTDRNLYGDIKTEGFRELVTNIVFNWEAYKLLLNFYGESKEGSEIPITALSKVNDDIPRGSVVIVDDMIMAGGNRDIKRFKVHNIKLRSNGHIYNKELTLIPDRGTSHF